MNIESSETKNYEEFVENYSQNSILQKLVNTIHDLKPAQPSKLTFINRSNRIIILVEKKELDPVGSINEAKLFSLQIQELINSNYRNLNVKIGIGRQRSKIISIYKSFNEANQAIRLTKRFDIGKQISHYDDYSVYHFLESNIKPQAMDSFINKYLRVIHQHDSEHGTDFINTLENYFLYNRNVSEAAKAMFIHRNTFIYRIEKIKEILKTDLKGSEELLQLQLSIKLFRLQNKN